MQRNKHTGATAGVKDKNKPSPRRGSMVGCGSFSNVVVMPNPAACSGQDKLVAQKRFTPDPMWPMQLQASTLVEISALRLLDGIGGLVPCYDVTVDTGRLKKASDAYKNYTRHLEQYRDGKCTKAQMARAKEELRRAHESPTRATMNMPYFPQNSLMHFLKTRRTGASPVEAVRWGRQLLTALAAMEGTVMHRDIKSENILVRTSSADSTVDVVLCDFGLASIRATPGLVVDDEPPQLHRSRNVQTIWYRAPEVFLGTGDYTEKVDVWSVGITLVEAMWGCRCPVWRLCPKGNGITNAECCTEVGVLMCMWQAFGTPVYGGHAAELAAMARHSGMTATLHVRFPPGFRLPLPKGTPPELRKALQSMLSLNPTERCTAAQALELLAAAQPPKPRPRTT